MLSIVHPPSSIVEEAAVDATYAIANGYSQSKWVAETILTNAAQQTSIKPVIIRIGQVSGALNGYWNETDWFPAMIKSSRALNGFPNMNQVRGEVSYP